MPQQQITPEQMQQAVRLNNQRTGRATPYQNPGAMLNPGAAPIPPQATLPNGAPAVPPWMQSAPNASPEQVAASAPASLAPVPDRVQAALGAQPAPAPNGAPSAQQPFPIGSSQIGTSSPAPMYRMAMNGQMVPVGMSASGGQMPYSMSADSQGPTINGVADGATPGGQNAILQKFFAQAHLNPSLPADREQGMSQFAAMQGFANDQQKQQQAMAQLGIEGQKLALAGQQFAYGKSMPGMIASAITQNPQLASDPVALANLGDALGRVGFGAGSPMGAGQQGGDQGSVGIPAGQGSGIGLGPRDSAMMRLRGIPGGADLINGLHAREQASGGGMNWENAFDQIRGALGDEGLLRNADDVRSLLVNRYGADPLHVKGGYEATGFLDNPTPGNFGKAMVSVPYHALSGLLPGGGNFYTPQGRSIMREQAQQHTLGEGASPAQTARANAIRAIFGLKGMKAALRPQ